MRSDRRRKVSRQRSGMARSNMPSGTLPFYVAHLAKALFPLLQLRLLGAQLVRFTMLLLLVLVHLYTPETIAQEDRHAPRNYRRQLNRGEYRPPIRCAASGSKTSNVCSAQDQLGMPQAGHHLTLDHNPGWMPIHQQGAG